MSTTAGGIPPRVAVKRSLTVVERFATAYFGALVQAAPHSASTATNYYVGFFASHFEGRGFAAAGGRGGTGLWRAGAGPRGAGTC